MRGDLATMPSGVPVGDIDNKFVATLKSHYGQQPLHTLPVIEDGTYADFKACVFRVCALRAFEVLMDDLSVDLATAGLRMQVIGPGYRRRWCYKQDDNGNGLVTEVELMMEIVTRTEINVETILYRLGGLYGFIFDRLSVDRRSASIRVSSELGRDYCMTGKFQPPTVKVRLLWSMWT